MKGKTIKWLGTVCCATMLLATLCGTAIATEAMLEEEQPQVAIELTEVEAYGILDGTLEVGFNVTSHKFQSAATVLRYDSTCLELLDWSTPQPVLITEAQASWANAKAVQTVLAVDGIGAKPALAYREGKYVYLMIGVESAAPIVVNESLATLRFRCVDDEDGAKMQALVKDTTAIGRAGSVLSFAPKDVAERVVSAVVQCTVEQNGGLTVYADTPFGPDTATGTITTDWRGVQRGTGAAKELACAVTFLDWDGNVLETAVVTGAGDATSRLTELMKDETLGLKAALSGKPGYEFDCWLDVKACETRSDAPYPANNVALDRDKYQDVIVEGKSLLEHLSYGSGTGATLQASYKAKRNAETGEYDPEFAPWTGSGKNPNYLFNFKEIVYDRYGGATENIGKYSVIVPVSRIREENGTVYGVERAVKFGARISMKPKDHSLESIYSYQVLGGQDEVLLEMVPTKDMEYLAFEVIDTNGFSTWISAQSRGGSVSYLQMKDIIPRATAHYIFRQAKLKLDGDPSSEWDMNVDAQAFKDINGGEDVLDVEALKAAILAAVAEQGATENKSVAQRSALLEAEPRKLSVEDELDFILGLIGAQTNEVNCTIQSYSKNTPMAFAVSIWSEESGAYIKYESPENKPIVSSAQPSVELGGGLCRQKFELSLRPGKYKMEVSKISHVPIEIVGFQVSTRKGESQDIEIAYADANGSGNVTAFYMPCGDINGDEYIRIDDYSAFMDSAKLGKPAVNGLEAYDLNGDGYVTMADVDIITHPSNFGKSKLVFQIS